MIADTAIQQPMDTNGQTLVTSTERQSVIQQLNTTWSLPLATKVENLAFGKSGGVKHVYHKMIQAYNQQLHNTNQRRLNQQQQQQQASGNPNPLPPTVPVNTNNNNNNGQYLNQQLNFSQTSNPSVGNVPPHQLNPMVNLQPRFPLVQQPRLPNPSPGMIRNQPSLLNQNLRSREPQSFTQTVNYPSSTNDLSSASANNPTLNDYLSSTVIPPNRFLTNPRQRTPSLNANFSQQPMPTATNPKDVLHQFVAGNTPSATNVIPAPPLTLPTATTTNTSSSGDRLLQQILLSDSSGSANKMPTQHRAIPAAPPPTMPPQLRPSTSLNTLRPSLQLPQQVSPTPSAVLMPTSTNSMQPSPNMSIQASPSTNSIPTHTDSINRSASGQISSPDEETINLIQYLKENLNRIQNLCQRFATEGQLEKARNAQNIQQQMVQFITNPTYETLPSAKHIRDILERFFNRPQPTNPASTSAPTSSPQTNEINQFEKVLQEFLSRDTKKSLLLTRVFIEPLSDVINGAPHKKFRLDDDQQSNPIKDKPIPLSSQPSSLLILLNNELNSLRTNRFSIEYLPVSHTTASIQLDDEYLSKNGLVLRCKLLEQTNPIIPTLRIRISTRYPGEQPEILSLSKTMPPKLENTDGHPFFQQLSTIFVSQLFKLPPRHTISDILHVWHQSVQMAL